MKSPRTTYCATVTAVGMYLQDLVSVPYWVNVVGKTLMIVGTTLLGAAAADNHQVRKQSESIEQLKSDTKSTTR